MSCCFNKTANIIGYRKKLHTVYPMLYKPTLKRQKLNSINYKHETNALAYTFKAGRWQI